jgi:hypothetical protein
MPVGLLPSRSAQATPEKWRWPTTPCEARGVPYGRLGSDFDHALGAPVPVGDLGRLPDGPRIFGHHRKVGQPLALYARPPHLARPSWRGRLVEGAIQPQAGYEGDRGACGIGRAIRAMRRRDRPPPRSRAPDTSALAPRAAARPTRLSSCGVCPALRRSAGKEPEQSREERQCPNP